MSNVVADEWQSFSGYFQIWNSSHNDVIKWKYFPRYWPFVRGIHRWPQKGQRRGALMFSLICAWINGWVNNRKAGDLRGLRAHYDVIVMDHCITQFISAIIINASGTQTYRIRRWVPEPFNYQSCEYTGRGIGHPCGCRCPGTTVCTVLTTTETSQRFCCYKNCKTSVWPDDFGNDHRALIAESNLLTIILHTRVGAIS